VIRDTSASPNKLEQKFDELLLLQAVYTYNIILLKKSNLKESIQRVAEKSKQ